MATRCLKPEPIRGAMPEGEAEDPQVSALALQAARNIGRLPKSRDKTQHTARVQLEIEAAINAALERCQQLGGRWQRWDRP